MEIYYAGRIPRKEDIKKHFNNPYILYENECIQKIWYETMNKLILGAHK